MLHTDMYLWTTQCSGAKSATVWLLLDAAVDPLPASPIYAISASSALNRTADHFLAEAEGCDASTSWATCATVDADPAHCAPEAVPRRARDRWPSLRSELDLVAGPVRAMHGVAWRGQTCAALRAPARVLLAAARKLIPEPAGAARRRPRRARWNLTRDLHARAAVLLQYGTEECVRSLRDIRVPVDIRKRWRTTDWLPFVQVPVGGLEPGARSPLSLEHLFQFVVIAPTES